MIYEFEGKTEKEAIDKAVAELNLQVDQFDVEILEIQKGGLFKKGSVKIRVHVDEEPSESAQVRPAETRRNAAASTGLKAENARDLNVEPVPEKSVQAVSDFIAGIVQRMGYEAEVSLVKNNQGKLVFRFLGEKAPHIIGKKGKTLDALQLFGNIYLAKLGYPHVRVVVDCENYRRQKEETIIRMAYDIADKVTSTRQSILMEPMNPYERRIVHTTLQDVGYIETKSEGSGLYKQVRVIYKK